MDKQQESSVVLVPQRQEEYPNLNAGNPGNKGGPTKYETKYADEIIEFFSIEKTFRYIKKERISTKKDGTQIAEREYAYMANDLPTMDKFGRSIGVDRATLKSWADIKYPADYEEKEKRGKFKHPKFHRSYKKALDLQKEFLVDNGLKGMYHPVAFVFVAQNFTDMRQKQAIDHTTKGKELPAPILGGVSNVQTDDSNK